MNKNSFSGKIYEWNGYLVTNGGNRILDDTIAKNSKLGERLDKIPKTESIYLKFQGKSTPIIDTITIGRKRNHSICIDNDSMVSRDHAMIQKLKEAYFIKDLGSANGTFVNNTKVPQGKFMRIKSSDEIRVGRTVLKLKMIKED